MKILVLGAGRMGRAAAYDLIYNSTGVESVTLADLDFAEAEDVAAQLESPILRAAQLDVSDYAAVVAMMNEGGYDAAISCVNYWHNFELAKAAIETRTNFCDLGGSNAIVDKQLTLNPEASDAGINIIPDCGLAPGMVSVLAMHGARRFDDLEAIHIRVGGLPQNPNPPLKYQLVFSIEGLINEYIEKSRVIRNGEILEVDSMDDLELIHFDKFPMLEAFLTSGGVSTLPETFLGKVKELDYKTIRYVGHCKRFKPMIDLGLFSDENIRIDGVKVSPRKVLTGLLRRRLPADNPDYVLIRLEFTGEIGGERKRLRYDIVDRFDEETNLSAMMRTTAFPASIIAQMMACGDVKMRGATPQEKAIDPEKFVAELARRDIKISESFRLQTKSL